MTILAGALLWGGQRILQQEEDKFRVDFAILVGYIGEQEQLLRSLEEQARRSVDRDMITLTPMRELEERGSELWQVFQGRDGLASMPFSLVCYVPDTCPVVQGAFKGIGPYISDFYSSHWASSYYPAAQLIVVWPNLGFGLTVPAVAAGSTFKNLPRETTLWMTEAVTELVSTKQRDIENAHGETSTPLRGNLGEVEWIRGDKIPNAMIGVLSTTLPLEVSRETEESRRTAYIATLLSTEQISIYEKALDTPQYDQFWLERKGHGVLLGPLQSPARQDAGFQYGKDGFTLKITDISGEWTGYYKLTYATLFQANMWLPIGVMLTLLLGSLSAIAYTRWYNKRVVRPAEEAHADLVESEAFNRTVLETAPVGLCVLSRPEGTAVFANALATQWLGLTARGELEHSPDANNLLRRALGTNEPGIIDSFRTLDGRTLIVTFFPTRYKKQDVVLCAFSDISTRAESEHALAIAKDHADKASEAKSTFLATMSHEIRTPLYGVLGSLEVLAMTRLDEEQRRQVDRIQMSSIILQQLISDILDITKIETGQLTLEISTFCPRELVESTVASFSGSAEQKGLIMYSCIDPAVPEHVEGDGNRLRQILSNLLNNAVKFTDSGHVIARLSSERLAERRVRLSFQVVDSGVGIGAAEQLRLFEPFYQIDGSSHTVRGAGIGLSICAKLAELMGSSIHVTSELGLGSSFSLKLDCEQVDGELSPKPNLNGLNVLVRSSRRELNENICQWLTYWGARATPQPPEGLSPSTTDEILVDILLAHEAIPAEWPGLHLIAGNATNEYARTRHVDRHSVLTIGFALERLATGSPQPIGEAQTEALRALNLRVLVAEDNPINQVTIRDQLEQIGCTVVISPDGEEALSQLGIQPFDVVLTDLNMPRLNGYDLARAIRAQKIMIPIIGITANAMKEEERRCREAGMNSWLVKPISIRSLWLLLSQCSTLDENDLASLGVRLQHAATTEAPVNAAVPEKYRSVFLDAMTKDLDKLEQALRGSEESTVLETLHRMGGGVGAVGLTDLQLRISFVEDRIRAGSLIRNEAIVSELVLRLRTTLQSV